MAASVDSQSPASLTKSTGLQMDSTSSPLSLSPSSEKRLWSALQSRVDSLIQNRVVTSQRNDDESERVKRLKEDSMLLLRGFDSVSQTLSRLSNNIDNALQGARDLGRSPTLKDILHSKLRNSERGEENADKQQAEENQRGLKRKYDPEEGTHDQADDAQKNFEEEEEGLKDSKKFKKAKNIAISMTRKAASIARELKSVKSDLCFVQERCALLEEENRRLRDGFAKGIRPEEDDLVRLQLEALLAEKSRLANENANLIRENQCLHQLVEYHQITSQDLSASYEQVIQGMCLDFSSPTQSAEDVDGNEAPKTPKTDIYGISTSLDELYHEEE